jgi:hypothetical protein
MQLTRVVAHAALQRIDRDMLHIDNKQYDVTRGANPLQRALGSLAQRYITLPLSQPITSGDLPV